MIMQTEPEGRFVYRVAGVAIHDGRVLLHRAESEDFWSLPGGRCELLEPSETALRREMREELGMEVAVERLVWVVENFFALDGLPHHELGLYYKMALPADAPLLDVDMEHRGKEEELALVFRWFPLETIERMGLYPVFLRAGLQALPATTAHIVNFDSRDDDIAVL
ncbi:MAG TPA: NUDIX hydrolase [Ktedonobacterales bacterium]